MILRAEEKPGFPFSAFDYLRFGGGLPTEHVVVFTTKIPKARGQKSFPNIWC